MVKKRKPPKKKSWAVLAECKKQIDLMDKDLRLLVPDFRGVRGSVFELNAKQLKLEEEIKGLREEVQALRTTWGKVIDRLKLLDGFLDRRLRERA